MILCSVARGSVAAFVVFAAVVFPSVVDCLVISDVLVMVVTGSVAEVEIVLGLEGPSVVRSVVASVEGVLSVTVEWSVVMPLVFGTVPVLVLMLAVTGFVAEVEIVWGLEGPSVVRSIVTSVDGVLSVTKDGSVVIPLVTGSVPVLVLVLVVTGFVTEVAIVCGVDGISVVRSVEGVLYVTVELSVVMPFVSGTVPVLVFCVTGSVTIVGIVCGVEGASVIGSVDTSVEGVLSVTKDGSVVTPLESGSVRVSVLVVTGSVAGVDIVRGVEGTSDVRSVVTPTEATNKQEQ